MELLQFLDIDSVQLDGDDVDLSSCCLNDRSVVARLSQAPDTTRSLYLFTNHLRVVPTAQLARFKQLRLLWLGNNFITDATALPPLPTLRKLDLASNCIRRLPASFFVHRDALTSLWLNHNQLTSLPREICSLVSLQRLWLDHNKLRALPTSMVQLRLLDNLSTIGNLGLPPALQQSAIGLSHAQEVLLGIAREYARHDRCRTCALLLVYRLRPAAVALPNEMLRRIAEAVWSTRNEDCWIK